MTNEAALKLTAEITVATVQHMADEASVSFDETLAAIIAGGNARSRFDAFMRIAAHEAQTERDLDRGAMEHAAWYDTSAELR